MRNGCFDNLEEMFVKRVVASMVVLGCLWGLTAAAQAQDKVRVGMLDLRKVLVESKPGQRHRAEIEKMVKERRDKLTKEETAIKSLQEKLEKDKLVLTQAQKEQKQKEIEGKIADLQKVAQEYQQQVSKRDNELSGAAGAVVREIIADVAKQEKLVMVVDKNQAGVYWVAEPVDITERVAKAYEAKAGK